MRCSILSGQLFDEAQINISDHHLVLLSAGKEDVLTYSAINGERNT